MTSPSSPAVSRRSPKWRWVAVLAVLAGVVSGVLFWAGASRQTGEDGTPAPSPAQKDVPPWFQDVTASSGVSFAYRNGEEADQYTLLESFGGGVALLDYDGDGKLDIFVTGGGYFDGPRKNEIKGYPSRLYRNLGGWKFQDVTAQVGLDGPLFYTHGAAVADYNRDGWPDLLVTGWGRLALYRNDPVDPADPSKGRRFTEVTQAAGLTDHLWSTSAAWGDLDGDGYPDLYVCHYADWSFANHPTCIPAGSRGTRDICSPRTFAALPHTLYRNNRDGTFRDVSAPAGLRVAGRKDASGKPVELGRGLGVVIADLDGDRRPDVYVANDETDNFLYLNRGGGKLQEVGALAGVARDERGVAQGSMGVDVADYDHSGLPSLFVTNYEQEMHALYRNLGKGEQFLFVTPASGIAAIGQRYVGFGTRFVDVDHDGWEDLVIVNGHVLRHPALSPLRQQPVLLRNVGGGRFVDVTGRAGPYFAEGHRGRGLAVGDLDNDGWPDLVVSNVNEPVALLRNVAGEGPRRPHWLGLELGGRQHGDLVGARVVVQVGARRLTRWVVGGGSYLSSGDARLLFGLGSSAGVERVSVDWPSGQTQHWEGAALAVDQYWRLLEGVPAPRPWRVPVRPDAP